MAIGEMAYMKDNGYGMPMNKEEAEKIYLQLAEERDDEWSMIKLAYIEMDRGNSEERLKWIQKALEKEYIDAYVDLGIFYQSDEKYKDLEIWLLCMKTASEPMSTNKRLGIYI